MMITQLDAQANGRAARAFTALRPALSVTVFTGLRSALS
jgi:hypothetical protein